MQTNTLGAGTRGSGCAVSAAFAEFSAIYDQCNAPWRLISEQWPAAFGLLGWQ